MVGDVFSRMWENITGRTDGTMSFRFIMQPLVASFFAIRAAIRDARAGNPPYLETIFSDKSKRRGLLLEGWKDVGKIFVFAVVLDLIYQIIVLKWFYPGEALVVAAVLAFLPYVLLRGPIARLVRRSKKIDTTRTGGN